MCKDNKLRFFTFHLFNLKLSYSFCESKILYKKLCCWSSRDFLIQQRLSYFVGQEISLAHAINFGLIGRLSRQWIEIVKTWSPQTTNSTSVYSFVCILVPLIPSLFPPGLCIRLLLLFKSSVTKRKRYWTYLKEKIRNFLIINRGIPHYVHMRTTASWEYIEG